MTSRILEPLTLRGTTLRNRIWLAPMCQYSAVDGMPSDWHLVHLGARASGGFGLVLTEATAVLPEGRISPQDTGIWDDEQQRAWSRIVDFVHDQGAHIGIQLAHAGRKASTSRPWEATQGTVAPQDGGWEPLAPSPIPFEGYVTPQELTAAQIGAVVEAFVEATRRSHLAGFDVVEVHAAHGYLLHQFLSPLSNRRTDGYGGSLANRSRLLLEVVTAVREEWPQDKPLLVRVSATDWAPDGVSVQDVTEVASWLAGLGVDLVDVSSGGNAPADIPVGPGYQVPLARAVRAGGGIPVAAVGLITTAEQAEQVLVDGAADAVLIGRAALRDPMWPLRAAHELRAPVAAGSGVSWPPQYARGAWR
ncbi:NADH:flavin oxidoreductase/NADH oxidase [Actinotalea sp. K2]|uniref:NADH:flavin oxidoreductase/NADH oxidase n=1 Tax=Actinotalea sp. K2 TaxID=2939438 RepID=UPI0020179A7D|nr:NADH:flavin oxidoreductase/NADH oxidase [Actinotalea sp. K2]MCL3861364.1 NADH:flavin oxidoreductase/NADH oxidase [Actinotalea sp. K2]